MRPLRVFLCHASQDKPVVWKLHRYLKQHGIKPWLDREDLLPGENWEVEIPRAIHTSDVILVCLSKNSVNKEGMVQKEITFALDKALEKPEGTIFIIPVKLEECDVPHRLNRYQWVDYYRIDGRKRLLMGLNKCVNDLGGEVQQITLDDTRHRTPAPKTPKPEKPAAGDGDRGGLAGDDDTQDEADELARKAAAEKIALEKAERDAALEKENREAKEKAEREAIEKAAREKLVLEAMEKAKLEKAEREAALEKANREAEKKAREKQAREISEKAQRDAGRKKQREFISSNSRLLGIGGLVLLVLIFGGFGLNYLVQNLPAPTATASPTDTATPRLPTSTKVPLTPTSTPILRSGSTLISEKDGMVLVYVPMREFTMGSNDGGSDEQPIHQVDLDAFWIDRTEVTNKMYAKCVDAGKCDPPDIGSHYSDSKYANHPVGYVSWNDALSYCSWAERRLPTEAEWEKAARGTSGWIYPWGIASPNSGLLNYNQNVGDTTEVGKYPNGASSYGAFDMAGNVWEWVHDWYGETYYKRSPSSNPLGPDSGQYRVLRGGSWNSYVNGIRSADRYWFDPSYTDLYIGFRCARSPQEQR